MISGKHLAHDSQATFQQLARDVNQTTESMAVQNRSID